MARKDDPAMGEQLVLFPVNPAVKNLGVTSMKLKPGLIEMDVVAATEATSLDQLTPEIQASAFIEHAVRLMGGSAASARLSRALDMAIEMYEADVGLGFKVER